MPEPAALPAHTTHCDDNTSLRQVRLWSSSLDPHESPAQSTAEPTVWGGHETLPTLSTAFRHSRWQRHRAAIYDVMAGLGLSALRISRFAWCGSRAWILRSVTDPDRLRVASNVCHDRFCTPCTTDRARRIKQNLERLLPTGDLRFLTLTIRHSTRGLAEQLRALRGAFARLRRSKYWLDNVDAGVWFLEIKTGSDRRSWHPHLHVLIHGTYMPQATIATLWHRLTGESFIVHISKVRDGRDAARYVAKYASKPMTMSYTNQPFKLCEAILALRSVRLLAPFGAWKSWKLTERPDPQEWEPVAPLDEVFARAAEDDPWAIDILTRIGVTRLCQQSLPRRTNRFPHNSRGPPSLESPCLPTAQGAVTN